MPIPSLPGSTALERLLHAPSFVLYSIPFFSEKKGVFYKFSNSFENPPDKTQRNGQNCQKKDGQICQPIAQAQHPRAEYPEIDPAPRHAEGRTVQPDLAPPGLLRPNEQGCGGGEPEQQIQNRPQQGQMHPHPQDAKQIVQHPKGQPQDHRLHQGTALLGHFNRHPPSRRPNNPPLVRRSSV